MNKKGDYFSTFLMFSSIFLIGFLVFLLYGGRDAQESVVGGKADAVFDAGLMERSKAIYLDQAGVYAFYDSLIRLLEEAAINEDSCGEVDGVPYIERTNQGLFCYQDDVVGEWSRLFNIEMDKYLNEKDNFKVEKTNEGYAAVMQEEIVLDVNGVSYRFKHDIPYSLSFDIDSFSLLLKDIEKFSKACYNVEDRIGCWTSYVENYNNYAIDVSNDGNLFMFTITLRNTVKAFFGEKEVVIHFAIDYRSGLA